jgi:hypothetical protein
VFDNLQTGTGCRDNKHVGEVVRVALTTQLQGNTEDMNEWCYTSTHAKTPYGLPKGQLLTLFFLHIKKWPALSGYPDLGFSLLFPQL